jgi:hypothetical protein
MLIANLLNDGHFAIGVSACGMEPHVNFAIYLADRPVLYLRTGGNRLAVRDVVTLPITAELPAVEGALDRLANDFTVNTQMRAEVRTEGVMHARLTGLCSVNNEFAI